MLMENVLICVLLVESKDAEMEDAKNAATQSNTSATRKKEPALLMKLAVNLKATGASKKRLVFQHARHPLTIAASLMERTSTN